MVSEKQIIRIQLRIILHLGQHAFEVAVMRQGQHIGRVMHAKRRCLRREHHLRGLPFKVEIKNADAHIADSGVAAKMRHLFQPLHAEAKNLRRHDDGVERINRNTEAVFVEQPVCEVDLWMATDFIRVEFEMSNRRAVHNHLMKRAMPNNNRPIGTGGV